MTLGDLINECWIRTADNPESPVDPVYSHLTTKDTYTSWANEAILEACERSCLLYDDTSDFCTIDVIGGTRSYDLDPSIRVIDKARLASSKDYLYQESTQGIVFGYGNKWIEEQDTPRYYIRHKDRIDLFPLPKDDDTITLQVYRRPLATEELIVSNLAGIPVIPTQYHRDLVYWMLYRHYGTANVEVNPKDVAGRSQEDRNLERFERRFGVRHSARYDQIQFDFPGGASLPIIGVK